MDRLTAMESFQAVVDAGSFSGAAMRLHLSKAVVSKRVSSLERHLGVQLLNRNTRQVCVTSQGAAFYNYCSNIVRDFNQASETLRQGQDKPEGELKLAIPLCVAKLLQPILMDFINHYPDIHLKLHQAGRQLNPIADGYDMALCVGRLDDCNLVARRLASLERCFCASPAYAKGKNAVIGFEQLKFQRFLALRQEPKWEVMQSHDNSAQELPTVFTADSYEMLMGAALDGQGIALMPRSLIQPYLDSGQLVEQHLPTLEPLPIEIFAVWPPNLGMPVRQRLLIEHLVDNLD
ncbi:LysR family transcriptional regulator [Gallaecimonas pentaromativorans]|uniref:LysR family transcriptional regulator n=2 Tax=Gammaproteobacteria TaxID=1236 RepID=UPI003A8D485E